MYKLKKYENNKLIQSPKYSRRVGKLVYTIYTENEDVEIWNIIIQDNENIYCFRAEKKLLKFNWLF